MRQMKRSFCRCCANYCAIWVEVDDGRAVRVTGDDDDPLYGGYTCVKGRAQPEYLTHPNRLLHSLKRTGDGDFVPIPVADAMDEIAEQLLTIRDRYGPRAIAGFLGTMSAATSTMTPMYRQLLALLGTEMAFGTNTIDKGGKQIAQALLGRWMAPPQGWDEPEVALLIGINPLISYSGFPAGNPGRWMGDALRRGMRMIVIDPRRSDVARRATIHLQAAPGHDAELLAAMIRVILEEERHDAAFVAENVGGIAALRRAVAPFTPEEVARRADVAADDVIAAARMFADAPRGYAMAGTGPSMSGSGTLLEYLVLVLETLCGHWLRAGEPVRNAPSLTPTIEYKAQAQPPFAWSLAPLRVRSLTNTTAGLPATAMADEILLEGPGQIRALLSCSGNPVLAFPDQLRTIAALESLDLLVQVDPWMSATARLADYVIAPTMPLEAPDATLFLDFITGRGAGSGTGLSYANYSEAIVEPPEGAALIEEWKFFQGLHERIEPALRDRGEHVPVTPEFVSARTTDEVLAHLATGSRIPFDDVKAHPGGRLLPEPPVIVAAKDVGWEGKLDVANGELLAELAVVATEGIAQGPDDADFPFRLLCRRGAHVYNSSFNFLATNRGRPYNPAYIHPADLLDLGLEPGDLAEIRSSLSAIHAVVHADENLRRGSVSMMYGFGGAPDRDHEVREIGANPNRLIRIDEVYDRYIGQPRMSNLPVRITKIPELANNQ